MYNASWQHLLSAVVPSNSHGERETDARTQNYIPRTKTASAYSTSLATFSWQQTSDSYQPLAHRQYNALSLHVISYFEICTNIPATTYHFAKKLELQRNISNT